MDSDGNLVEMEATESVLSQMKRKEEQKAKEAKSRRNRTGSRADSVSETRPPWRAGSVADNASHRAFSRASTYIDEHGNKITSTMIKKRRDKEKKSRGARRKSKFEFAPSEQKFEEMRFF